MIKAGDADAYPSQAFQSVGWHDRIWFGDSVAAKYRSRQKSGELYKQESGQGQRVFLVNLKKSYWYAYMEQVTA